MAQAILGNITRNDFVLGHQANQLSAYLTSYDTVFLLDDSAYLKQSDWAEIRNALLTIMEEAMRFDADGISVRFLNDPDFIDNTKNTSAVQQLVSQVQPGGNALISQKLRVLIDEHNERSIRAQGISLKALYNVKPLNIIVLTNGDFIEPPVAIIRRLRPALLVAQQIPMSQDVERRIGIQFVQVGSNLEAMKALENLDTLLPKNEDMIDTVRWDGTVTPSKLYKILLGSVHRGMDDATTTSIRIDYPPAAIGRNDDFRIVSTFPVAHTYANTNASAQSAGPCFPVAHTSTSPFRLPSPAPLSPFGSSVQAALLDGTVSSLSTSTVALVPDTLNNNEYALRIPAHKAAVVRAISNSQFIQRVIVSSNPPRVGFPHVLVGQGQLKDLVHVNGSANAIAAEGEIWLTIATEYGRLNGSSIDWLPAPNKLLVHEDGFLRIGVNNSTVSAAGEYDDMLVTVETVRV
ncbi:hypothetical protein BKA62DRAFT_314462 [Auriculariales sp. MPI-PUGE-AT-0066]|nr:hypothetical protein BKA62DRAFT_314462 [Auriculariales sp. MPI-PUGE-AT-0066]